MPLSWNEIKSRALAFSKEWENDISEDAEAKSFWDDFFNVFGISRRRVATFEQQVKKIDNKAGFIDLLWKGTILVEHKSRGKSLNKAYQQAKDYFPGLKEAELPRYILVSDFENFRLYDLDTNNQHDFTLIKFTEYVHLFGFIAGYQKRTYKEQDPVNIEAAELMGRLHDKLKSIGYEGHYLEVYLVRLVFLLFADDTNIWEKGIFYDYLDLHTKEDGSDLAAHLMQLFEVLNTEPEKRLRNLDESLSAFPFINGKLFEERLPMASFDSTMRRTLMDCCMLDWGKISPAIFGSLFQSVMDARARRNLGAHYTSEKNILKLIKPLFLDEYWKEFETARGEKRKLNKLHEKISKLRFLDPACGCGNFLIIAYRELRLLEMEIVKQQLKGQTVTDISSYFTIDVDGFYGIEYEEFPAQIAQVAMWLIDHQMNMKASETFGEYYVRLPLRKSATIVHGNALRIDWQSLIEPLPWEKVESTFDFIMGNPPFIGKSLMNASQKADMEIIFNSVKGAGVLDYVTAWYIKAAQYMLQFPETISAFVSTNSISQGEQVGLLWNELFTKYKSKIHFAHRTFSWSNEARGNAAVHVVIIGFANFDVNDKNIFEYENIKGEPNEIKAKNINPYLVEGKDNFIPTRKQSICNVPPINYGSMANDGGHLLLDNDERNELLLNEPTAIQVIRPFLGSQEFINKITRWCIWLKDVPPNKYTHLKSVLNRIQKVKEYRLKSTRATTQKLASYPMLFGEIRQPNTDYLFVPGVSSENRDYIPIGFLTEKVIASDLARTIPNATLYLFGVLTSLMHMTWVKYVCGRLKSDYRYSNSLVYNNFPWPETPTEKQTKTVEKAAQQVLDARAAFPDSSLADLYDPNTMPPVLVKAHQQLDKAVDLCYRPQPFINEAKRIEFLFELYDKYTSGMFVREKKNK
ncbi:MAG: class I SAM-dependent DNA methyltransferase [Nitrosopumilus sp.]|nr:class I SAM-dependent DNA methyltransferase [Nitrosopumilus sp.]